MYYDTKVKKQQTPPHRNILKLTKPPELKGGLMLFALLSRVR